MAEMVICSIMTDKAECQACSHSKPHGPKDIVDYWGENPAPCDALRICRLLNAEDAEGGSR